MRLGRGIDDIDDVSSFSLHPSAFLLTSQPSISVSCSGLSTWYFAAVGLRGSTQMVTALSNAMKALSSVRSSPATMGSASSHTELIANPGDRFALVPVDARANLMNHLAAPDLDVGIV